VPNAALRFRPTSAQPIGAAGGQAQGKSPTQRSTSATSANAPVASSGATQHTTGGSTATLWHVDANGALVGTRVHTGLSDGQRTQVQGDGVAAGMRVIEGTSGGEQSATASAASTRSPFQQQQGGGPRPPGGF
jgi:hypothetical protein